MEKFTWHFVSLIQPLLSLKSMNSLICLILGHYNLFLQPLAFSRFDASLLLISSWFARDDYRRKDVCPILHGLVLLPFRCQLLKTWRRSWRASVPWNLRPVNFYSRFPPCSTSELLPTPCQRTSCGKERNAIPAGNCKVNHGLLSKNLPSDFKRSCCLFWKLFLIGWLIATMIDLKHFKVLFI